MKIALLLFALLIAMGLVLGYLLFFVEEPGNGHGVPHPEYATMLQGGDGARHQEVLGGGTLLGALMILFMVGLLAFGASQGRKPGMEEGVLAGGTVLFLFCYLAMILTYVPYADTGGGSIVLGFPVPTAWMLYGVWGAPVVFMLLYMLRFEAWIISDAEIERFLADTAADGTE